MNRRSMKQFCGLFQLPSSCHNLMKVGYDSFLLSCTHYNFVTPNTTTSIKVTFPRKIFMHNFEMANKWTSTFYGLHFVICIGNTSDLDTHAHVYGCLCITLCSPLWNNRIKQAYFLLFILYSLTTDQILQFVKFAVVAWLLSIECLKT